MKLVVFDIDGTLTRTNEADESCFASSVKEHFKIEAISTNWSDYSHSTDSGILDELVRKHKGASPSEKDLESFREVFVRHLENYYQTKKGSFQQVEGASALFPTLKKMAAEWLFAIATGGWKRSALLKLNKAGIEVSGVPSAFADDAFSRDEIIKKAISRTSPQKTFEKIVYVGDGHWDFTTCQRLKIPFVGVTDNRDPERLRSAGAKHLIRDYSDFDHFINTLDSAAL